MGGPPGHLVPRVFPHHLIEHLKSRAGLRSPDSPLAPPAAWHQGRRWRGQVRPAVCCRARTDRVGPQGPSVPAPEPAGWPGSEVQPRGREHGPPTPGGEHLAFRLAQAGRGKVCHVTLESSHLLTRPVTVWGGFRAKRAGERGRGDAGALLEGPSEGEGRWQHEPASLEVLVRSRHRLSCNIAQSTGSPPPGAKIAQAISPDSNQHLCLQEPELP